MLTEPAHLRKLAIIGAGLTAAIVIALWTRGGAVSGQSQGTSPIDSAAAWKRIATVLQHSRCLNCHQLESPLQGDERRPHVPQVVRGPGGHGVSAMRCGNCHNEMGNNPTSGTPGAPHWALAPASMLWQDLSVGDLCRMLEDPARNGDRSSEALIEHMAADRLVRWGWDPGGGREPVPIPHDEFIDLMTTWVAGGTACPE